MSHGETTNAAANGLTLKNLQRETFTKGVCFLHDDANFHTARATQELLRQFGWDILAHPRHSPDLAPNDYRLFTKTKEDLIDKDKRSR